MNSPNDSATGTPGNARTAAAPEDAAARLIGEGNLLEDRGAYREALHCYDDAIRTCPTLARAFLNRGNALLAMDDHAAALAAYAAALHRNPQYAAAYFNLGNAQLRLGHPEEALSSYKNAFALNPDFIEAEMAIGCALSALGRHAEAEPVFRHVVAAVPDHVPALMNLAALLRQLERRDEAADTFRRVLLARPDDAALHAEIAGAFMELGKVDDAVAGFRRSLAINPAAAGTLCSLGNALQALGRSADAAKVFHQAIDLAPALFDAHLGLGNAYIGLKDELAAMDCYRRAVQVGPDRAEAHGNLGNVLMRLGQPQSAVECYREALRIRPALALAHVNLANALKALEQRDAAIASYREALRIDPKSVEAHYNLANTLFGLEQSDEAVTHYRRALQLVPNFAEGHCNLGNAMSQLGRLPEAIASYRKALEIDPRLAEAHANLGNVLRNSGRSTEAVPSYRRALELRPDFAVGFTGLLHCLSHEDAVGPQVLFAEHCRFGERFETPLRGAQETHANDRDPLRPLRIGFVSADLRDHAVAHFIEPLLPYLASRSGLKLHAYFNCSIADATTQRLRRHFACWTVVHALSDDALAQRIRDDRIDILVDLSGHTGDNRLLTFARKPAPVQASWIGYPGTTGLKSMDYFLADRHFLPLQEFSGQFVEKLVHLPAVAPFLPNANAPSVNRLPALGNSAFTFGSFNRFSKLSPPVVALWSQLLRAVPNSRMLLGAMPHDGKCEELLRWFATEGIEPERLELHARCDTVRYLGLHHRVDLCLDTFPYTGGTTTAHALWMGVPTLTLAGQTPAGRQGAALLGQLGLNQFIATSPSEFVERGRQLASDREVLSRLREGLRQRCEAAPSWHPELIAAGLEQAFRIMWRRWCSGLAAEPFEVTPQSVSLP